MRSVDINANGDNWLKSKEIPFPEDYSIGKIAKLSFNLLLGEYKLNKNIT